MLNGELTAVLFLDFSDAFGSVNRLMLIQKLKLHLGISGMLLLYLINFLSGRMAHIKVNDLIGEWLGSEYGTSAGHGRLKLFGRAGRGPPTFWPSWAVAMLGPPTFSHMKT